MNGFVSVLIKEFMHLRRDPTTLRFTLLVPIIQMIIFGYAINFDVRHIQAVVVDLDNSRESRAYLEGIRATEYLDYVARTDSPEQAARMLKDGRARVAVEIPAGFARTTLAGGNPPVGVLVDGSDSQVSVRARFAFLAPPAAPPRGTPDVRVNVLFNPSSRTATYMIPGLVVVILQVITTALTAFSIVREKEMGTLEQLMVTPVGRLALMLGKLIPYALLAFVELSVIVLIGALVFSVPSRGSLIALGVLSVPFIIASLGLGLLISTFAQTQGQALQFTMLTVMPSILLSGYVSPRETMPGWLYVISSALPATHFMRVTRGILVRGAGFTDLTPQFLILVVIATVLVLASTLRFRKTIA